MADVLRHLTAKLDGNTRSAVWARADGLMRAVRYEAERQASDFAQATSSGWTVQRIEVICHLNAFYQIVLGPLASVARGNLRLGLVRDTAIAYGDKTRIDRADADLLHECHNQFRAVTERLGVDFWCLQSASAQDLLFKLAHPRSTP